MPNSDFFKRVLLGILEFVSDACPELVPFRPAGKGFQLRHGTSLNGTHIFRIHQLLKSNLDAKSTQCPIQTINPAVRTAGRLTRLLPPSRGALSITRRNQYKSRNSH